MHVTLAVRGLMGKVANLCPLLKRVYLNNRKTCIFKHLFAPFPRCQIDISNNHFANGYGNNKHKDLINK